MGAAIGAKLAAPQRRVVACLGDGSSMFGLQGLWTLAKYRVPLIVIVFNNRAYMAVKNQFRGSEERIRLAAEMGAEPAIKRATEQNGPALVDVVIGQNTRKD
jgi:thiamine pyrophosphate-dependent acetolactate synthase large subunit-like protein